MKNQEIHDHLNSTLKSIMASKDHRTLDLSSMQEKKLHGLSSTVNDNYISMSDKNLTLGGKTLNPPFPQTSFVQVSNGLDQTKIGDQN